jgi:dolichol-phosphate mannosyltransferase
VSPARSLVSVVLSFRNEEEVIPELVERLRRSLDGADVDHELVFVNDASTDRSLELLEKLHASDRRIKVINMSRRFGVAPCVIAGMRYARGDAVVYMDTDLQDPPELIPELVARWREGADVVYTVRSERRGESRTKLGITRAAYRLIQALAEIELPVEAGDFKLLSRRAVDHLLALPEQDLYVRGLVSWIGFRQVPVSYERQPRGGGRSHFPLIGSAGPAVAFLNGITSFSHAPLVAFLLLGVAGGAASLALLAGAALAVSAGLAWAAFALLLWSSLVLGIGVIGLYLARVHRAVLGRPRFIVESTLGVDEQR